MRVLTVRSKKWFFIVRMTVYSLKMIGLAPFSIRNKIWAQMNPRFARIQAFQLSKAGLAYNLLFLVLFLAVYVYHIYSSAFEHLFSDPTISPIKVIEIVKILLHYFTFAVVIISWSFKQKRAASIMNRLLEVDFRLSGLEEPGFDAQALTFFLIHVILNACLWITVLYVNIIDDDVAGSKIPFSTYAPITIIYWFVLQYFTIVSLTGRDLQTVNNYLLEFREFGNCLSRPAPVRNGLTTVVGLPTYYSNHLPSLDLLYNVRTTLFEVCTETADFFSLPILFCIASYFVSLLMRIYQISTDIQGGSVDSMTINAVSLVFMYSYPLVSLTFSVTRTKNEAKATGHIIHKLLYTAIRQEIRTKLEAFSLQLLHEDVDFTAYGLFSLDSSLLLSKSTHLAHSPTHVIDIIQNVLELVKIITLQILGGMATYYIVLTQDNSASNKH